MRCCVAGCRSLAQPGAKSFLARFLQKWLQRPTLLVLNAFFSLCVMINLLACLWWTVAEAEGLPNSWAAYIEGRSWLPAVALGPCDEFLSALSPCVRWCCRHTVRCPEHTPHRGQAQ